MLEIIEALRKIIESIINLFTDIFPTNFPQINPAKKN